jgi:hypothetical protein
MNIFYLSECPVEAARSMCDKHIVKMVLESAQILCTTHHECPTDAERPERFYRKTHVNHPSTIWVRETTGNYEWICLHALALCEEYTHRYGKVHASQSLIEWASDNIPDIPDGEITKMPQCMPDEFKTDCSVQAYRKYYNVDKRNSFKCVWTKREEPNWWKEHTCLGV